MRKNIVSRALPLFLCAGMLMGTNPVYGEEPPLATREYTIASFTEAAGLTGEASLDGFSDGNEISPEYESGVKSAVANGIIAGYEDGTLRPKENIRRVEALVILSRALPEVEEITSPIDFSDVPEWAKEDIARLSGAGIVLGYGDGRLGADDELTEEQVGLLTARVVKAEEPDSFSYTQKAPHVTDAMCHADYWTDADDTKVLLTPDEIQELNRRIMATDGTMMTDLENLPETYNGKKMATEQAAFESPKGIYLHGEPVEERYYVTIRNNIKRAKVSENESVKYAICTNRTEMKAYPYEDWLSDSSWDREWDDFVNTAVLVGEPLVLYNKTQDGKFIYAISECCEGWVPVKDVAICKDKEEWKEAKTHDNFLVVTGEKIWLEASFDNDLSQKMLTMGTVLELADEAPFEEINRLPWNNYIIKLPVRGESGEYTEKVALVSANRDVHVGFLPYTRANILTEAFKSLGNRYGWGGMLASQDCSAFAREVYLTVGLVLPRNTSWQMAMPVKVTDISQMTEEEKKAELLKTPAGALVFFPGHEMIYLGEKDGYFYTINDVSSLVNPEDPEGGTIRPRSVIVNDLSTLRGNGTTWLSNLSRIVVVE